MVPFPDVEEIVPHAIAFARMMFAHSGFEREVAALQDAITKAPGFGEQQCNKWGTRQRPARMVKLIEERRGQLPQTAKIEKLLTEAISPCDQRNLLAHGAWWGFNRPAATIIVRSATRWKHPEEPPEHREYTVVTIVAITEKFKDIEAELFKLRREIEQELKIPDIGLNSASDYFHDVVSPAYNRFAQRQTRANALEFALGAWHLCERLWHDRGKLGDKDRFAEALCAACDPELRLVHDLADAGKHHELRRKSVRLARIVGAENPGGIGEIAGPLGQTRVEPQCTLEIEDFDGSCHPLPAALKHVIEFWRSEITKP